MTYLTAPEGVARAALCACLTGDAALMALVNGVYDGTPGQAALPFVVLGEGQSVDWSTKSHEGRELTLALNVYGRSAGDSIRVSAAVRTAEIALAAMESVREGWQIVSVRVMRVRMAGSGKLMKAADKGGWSAQMTVRVRMMAV